MPPRISIPICKASQALVYRPRPASLPRSAATTPAARFSTTAGRFTDDKKGINATGPNQDVLPHISEEAAKIGEITGEGGPELEQGTPVQEILKKDPQARKNAPQILKEESKKTSPTGSRSFSTSARRPAEAQTEVSPVDETDITISGFKFEIPELPIPSDAHLHYRYDPVVKQVTNLLMRDGKKSVAQRNMSAILNFLRTAPPPQINPDRPLLPGSPPPSHLPLNPILYLTLALDSIAPLLKIRSQKGAAGGGMALQIPQPLHLRQRRRKAVQWILDAAERRQSRGSGKDMFAQRVAEELIAVVEGRSGVWEKRAAVHKMAVSNRANINFRRPKGGR